MWLRNETKSAQSEIDMLKLKLSSAEIPPTENLIQEIYDFLADDLKSADAIEAINAWVNSTGTGGNAKLLIDVIDGLLGIALTA
jgi:cell division septation protein DedD